MKKLLAITGILLIVVFSADVASVTSSAKGSKFIRSADAIPGRYIVVLNEKAYDNLDFANRSESASFELAGTYGGSVDKVYETALYGYSTEMSELDAIALSKDVRVQYVEEDAVIQASALQSNATWGLDRIDQRSYPLNSSYQYTSTGAGVHAYIIDSGIRITHQDFGGRASVGADFVGDGQNGNDCLGHGTHVAGTVGSKTYGVAKGVSLHAVRVLSCAGDGSVSGLISGINWVAANRVLPAVANVSIAVSGPSNALDTAVSNSIASGVTFAVAAGNNSDDACNYSPARIATALTVGSAVASGSTDYRMVYSNYGSCVDLFAPGNGIESLSNADDVSSRVMNGTSMAAPHVAGVAALYLQDHPTASPATVAQAVVSGATNGTVVNIDANSPNKMLYSWVGGAQPPALPASVTIIKQVNNAQGGTASSATFGYTASNLGTAGFSLVDNDLPPADRYVNPNVVSFASTSDIVVTESSVSGWALNSIQCVETAGNGMPNLQNSTVDLVNHRATIKVEEGEQVTCTFKSQELAPTSSPVSLSGRIVDSNHKGVKSIPLTAEDLTTGAQVTATTNSFGYFTFNNLVTAHLYIVRAKSRRYAFSPESQSIVLSDNFSSLNFVGTLR